MRKISVIVPIYNVENFLVKCIDHLIGQTYKNLEIILVDDGSKDSSGKLCDNYALKDERIRVIHKKNGGVSSARNAGLEIAQGNYIMFCDSDDYYDFDMAETLLKALEENVCDISMCGVRLFTDDKILEERIKYNPERLLKGEDLLKEYFNNDMLISSPVNKLYKKDVFNNLRYYEGIIYEDRYLSIDLFLNYSVYALKDAKYNYYMRSGSIIHSSFSEKRMDFLKIIDHEQIIADKYPNLQKEVNNSYCKIITMLLRQIIISNYNKNKHNYNKLIKLLRKRIEISNDNNINKFEYKKYYKCKYLIIFYYKIRNVIGKMLRKIGIKR